ncbi:uncharacterized protein LOC108669116 [Hyalella azteca]|uniref:Uncharacterized protein LOC108669116 n=1 Tax=Hyalella azteca TaxID=294128 RepID=A0A8B7NE62_HYAAZ|nr:uncharacterized protein LOC108669116 [Hyalella azteca]
MASTLIHRDTLMKTTIDENGTCDLTITADAPAKFSTSACVIQENSSRTNLWNLPYHILCKISTLLNLQDALSFASTCKLAHTAVMDQHTWRQRLWYWGKAVNVCMMNNSSPHLKEASAVISDPLLLNLRTMYEVLSPGGCRLRRSGPPVLDVANLLAKLDPSHSSNPTLMQNFFNVLAKILGHRVSIHEKSPILIGANESRYVLFSQPETRTSHSLFMTLITSRSNIIETVGLVEGRPGGIGSGVTVRYETVDEGSCSPCSVEPSPHVDSANSHIFNLLPLRRINSRLLTPHDTPGGVRFIDEVAEVVRTAAGIVCIVDGECLCGSTAASASATHIDGHTLELGALEAMLRTFPANRCPVVLLLLVHTAAATDCDVSGCQERCTTRVHMPYLLANIMDPWHIPWAAFEVEIPSLCGLSLALNWLVRRTAVHKTC